MLIQLAGSISDGQEIDWETAESTGEGDVRDTISQLKVLARIAAAHRGLQSPEPESGRTPFLKWRHLEIIEKIGTGSFGKVYRARDTHLDHEVALKLFHEHAEHSGQANRVIEEGRLLARVQHPNVARVLGADRHEGLAGVWMEFIHGCNLEELVEQRGTLGPHEAIGIGRDLCRALAAVHQAGVIHRDLKPKNIMREDGGRIVLADFGTGIVAVPGETEIETGRAGTPLYMAPELLLRGEASRRSDIYSLGVVLYNLVTRSYPVQGKDLHTLKKAHESGERQLLGDIRPDLPEAFVRVVERAIDPDPAQRFESAGQLERELARAEGSPAIPTVPWWRQLIQWFGRHPILSPSIAAIAIVIIWLLIPRPYTVDVALYRYLDGEGELLPQAATISVDDELFMEFKGSRRLYVYVVSRDEFGESWLLFPLTDSELQNPLPPGTSHRLPGRRDTTQFNWRVTSEGGRELIAIIASPERRADLEKEIASLPQAGDPTSPYRRLSEQGTELLLRGIGGLSEHGIVEGRGGGRITREMTDNLFEEIQALAARTEKANGTWARRIELFHRPASR